MCRHIIAAQRLKGAGADMQGNAGMAHPTRSERGEQRGIEVQTGGWRRHRARLAREDALIALAISGLQWAVDVWRQRHLAEALEEFHRGRRQLDAPQLRL